MISSKEINSATIDDKAGCDVELLSRFSGQQECVNQIAQRYGFDVQDKNAEICVLRRLSDQEILGVIGFTSDAGTNFGEWMGRELAIDHEKLYVDAKSFLNVNKGHIGELVQEALDLWLYDYLWNAARSSTRGVFTKTLQVFSYGVFKDDDRLLARTMERFDKELFEKALVILKYRNKEISL